MWGLLVQGEYLQTALLVICIRAPYVEDGHECLRMTIDSLRHKCLLQSPGPSDRQGMNGRHTSWGTSTEPMVCSDTTARQTVRCKGTCCCRMYC